MRSRRRRFPKCCRPLLLLCCVLATVIVFSFKNDAADLHESEGVWMPFFNGSSISSIPARAPGQLLQFCRAALNGGVEQGQSEVKVAHTLQQLQDYGNGVCLVRMDSPVWDAAAGAHKDPVLTASHDACYDAGFLGRHLDGYLHPGRGLNVSALCTSAAVAAWCSAKENKAHCEAYKVHNLPLERPVVAAFRNALVTPVGHIITPHLKFKPLGPCNFEEEAPISALPTHASEVVVATAHWGDTTYHALVENLPRLMVVWEDLLAQPHVLIAVGSSVALANYLEFMGLSRDRILHGNILADIAYVPNPGGCGYSPGHRYVQAVREKVHAALRSQKTDLKAASTILVIQRTGGLRTVANHDELVHAISREFPNVHLDVFADSHLPGFAQSVQLFYNAKVVIAPHGAGLSNLMLATSQAVAIEFVIAPPNACYLDLARELGNEYHAVYGHAQSENSPMMIQVEEVLSLVRVGLRAPA